MENVNIIYITSIINEKKTDFMISLSSYAIYSIVYNSIIILPEIKWASIKSVCKYFSSRLIKCFFAIDNRRNYSNGSRGVIVK